MTLMVKAIFKFPFRGLKIFLNSVFILMNVPMISPTYTCISKRLKTIKVKYRLPSRGAVAHVVIDATGLKIYYEGKWKKRKHGKEKQCIWRKLHLAVDVSTHEVISTEVSLVSVDDNEVLPILLNLLRRKIQQVSTNGAHGTRACHHILKNKGITPTIPPGSNAEYW
ncbi:hypothetical protein BTN49_0607 [Candidatus Enterovibrio escicola]|uniref:Transposase IS4-like domain-containing protein n=1 Tax=Candidatus Enterovibrio escicola TaxID=1927127 RepID=A0A2A5T683_9GAMM|nr:IS5 family transposase [Candidatus Enterovibrio escacola]PCS23638.1 hypothetical protein BTN49_0607 [Candidatus Enterovibrio escacola]